MHQREKGRKMTEKDMWSAVIENDKNQDGVFFYAVKTTGIYCRPSCKSKIPKRENVVFFKDVKQATVAGYRPCKRCRSDLIGYNPTKEIADKAKKLIDELFDSSRQLNDELKELGISKHHLVEVFKQEYGVTPKGYIDMLRLEEIKRLLSGTTDEIIDIAYSVGFDNNSTFYRFFKKHTGISPKAYRKETENDTNSIL